ncbi:MAG: lysophospholipid acyltransferase family protein [Acidobacteriota bacterium]
MKLDPNSRLGSAVLSLAGHLVRLLLLGIGATLRLEIIGGQERLRVLQETPEPVILSFWHERTFISAHFLYHQLHRRGFDITLLASLSRDGEMVTRMVRTWGIETVRGSASRGGRKALRAIHRAITRRGSSPIMIPDGPRGPAHAFKVGVAVLAQTTSAPILPLGFAAQKCWRLRSWDRLIVPKPFSRVAVVVGEPQKVDASLNSEELDATRIHLEEVLNDVTARAERAFE